MAIYGNTVEIIIDQEKKLFIKSGEINNKFKLSEISLIP
jgi:hypothetical protein